MTRLKPAISFWLMCRRTRLTWQATWNRFHGRLLKQCSGGRNQLWMQFRKRSRGPASNSPAQQLKTIRTWLSLQPLSTLGFSMDAYQTIYGMGVFPVMRLSLGNPQALRDTIGRIEQSSGIDFTELQRQGQPYWRLASGDVSSDSDAPIGIYIAIIEEEAGSQLAIGVLPSSSEPEFLPAFLGQAKPAVNTAANSLASVNKEYGYSAFGSGWLDFQRVFDQFVQPDSELRLAMGNKATEIDEHLDVVCKSEISSIIERAPRMLVGTTELTPSAMAGQYRLELANDLSSDLARLVSKVPSAPTQSDRLLEFAFGIRLGAARDFLIEKTTALSQEPFQCEALQDLNEQISDLQAKLSYPAPPLINNFLGLRASLSGLPEDEMDIGSLLGTVALYLDKPEMFVGMAKMFLPQLEEFELVKGEPPVVVPETLMPAPGIVAYAAMSDNALGIAVGESEKSRLKRFMDAKSNGDGTFLSANYDMTAYMERMSDLREDLQYPGSGGEPEYRASNEVAEAIREVVQNMAGRSQVSLRFDRHGFAIDSRMEFSQ
jgi:hypothetical protein